MTIRRGESWGERAIPPVDLARAASDAQAADLVRNGCREFLLTGGDMWRTLGGSSSEPSPADLDGARTVVSVDCLQVSWVDGGTPEERPVFAHAVIRLGRRRRSLHPGDICYAMNAQYLGSFDVAPRSHPNDGRFDIVTVEETMSWRQRRQLRHRLATGTHLPHPSIRTESVGASWSPGRPGRLILDGRDSGDAENVSITIHPDSLRIWF